MKSAVGLFNTIDQANRAVEALQASNFSADDINVIAHNGNSSDDNDATTTGATGGAVVGGALGILAGLGALAIPGIGPALVAGPIIGGLLGAGAGALSGSLMGSLVDAGVAEEDAAVYWEGIRRGGALVVVNTHGDGIRAATAKNVLQEQGAADSKERGNHWRSQGWGGYNEAADPYDNDALRAHRLDAINAPLTDEMEPGTMAGRFEEYMSLNVTGNPQRDEREDLKHSDPDSTLPVDTDTDGLPPTDSEPRNVW